MSQYKGLAEQTFDEPVSTGRAEPTVRPKVMRRPANFSGTSVQPTMPTIHLPPNGRAAQAEENENLALSAPSLPMVIPSTAKQWQDDLRFGVAMLTILLLVNLALIAWLPHLRPADTMHDTVSTAVTHDSIRAMPFGMHADSSALTVYEKPASAVTSEGSATGPDESSDLTALGGADSGPNQ